MTKTPVSFLSTLSKANLAIVVAFQKGYRVVGGAPYSPTGQKLKINYQNRNKYMRPRFSVNWNRESMKVYVHKLVAFQKFGFRVFDTGIQVRHLDGDSLNNHQDNIEIGDQSENMLDRLPEDRLFYAINASARLRKLTNAQIKEARRLRESGWTYKRLMARFGVKSKSTMHHILNNEYLAEKAV